MTSVSSVPDPFAFKEMFSLGGANPGRNFPVGRVLRSPALTSGEKTSVLICAGQSNICNQLDALYTPTNAAKIDNFNIYDGGNYAAVDCLLGCQDIYPVATLPGSNGNHMLRVADKLITAGATSRVILVPVGVGGTAVADWNAVFYQRIVAARRRLAAVGLTPTAVCWHQGEADAGQGTTQAAYQAGMTSLIAACGGSMPWFVAQVSYRYGTLTSAITAAQAALVNGSSILAGPNTDTIGSSGRQSDNIHFNAAGGDAAASLWVTKLTGNI